MTEIYVVRGLGQSLLDGDICEKLGVVKRVNAVTEKKTVPGISTLRTQMSFDPRVEYPELFKGLGRVKISYTIRLRPDANPYALTTPRRIPIPLLGEIKSNLDKMMSLGVITPVKEPTEWCAGLVLAPKTDGTIRMCVDYAIESLCYERGPSNANYRKYLWTLG